jgi:hypothetical protein
MKESIKATIPGKISSLSLWKIRISKSVYGIMASLNNEDNNAFYNLTMTVKILDKERMINESKN